MFSPQLASKGSTVMPRTPSQQHGALTGPAVFFPSNNMSGPFSYDTTSQKLTDLTNENAIYTSMVSVENTLVFARRNSGLVPPVRVEAWDLAANSLWNVEIDNVGLDFFGVAVGADGTRLRTAWAHALCDRRLSAGRHGHVAASLPFFVPVHFPEQQIVPRQSF